MTVVLSWNCNILKNGENSLFSSSPWVCIISFNQNTLLTVVLISVWKICRKNEQAMWNRQKKIDEKNYGLQLESPKKQREREKEMKPAKYVCDLFFAAGICFHLSSFLSFFHFFIRLYPKFLFVFRFAAVEKDGCECMYQLNRIYMHITYAYLYECAVQTDVFRCINMCWHLSCLSFSRQPLKMVDKISFWWQQTALQLQQWYQTYCKPAAVRGWQKKRTACQYSLFACSLFFYAQ